MEITMAKKKFYVVKKGKTPGIYSSWDECKSQVEGVSGALYKGFATQEEAFDYAGEELVQKAVSGRQTTLSLPAENSPQPLPELASGEALAYVDGSYNAETKQYSCGVVFMRVRRGICARKKKMKRWRRCAT